MDFDPQDIIDASNVDPGVYRKQFAMQDNENLSMHLRCSGGVTVKFYGTNDSNASESADTYWVDLSDVVLGFGSVADTEDIYFIEQDLRCAKFMVKYTATDSSNAIKVMILRS